MEDGTYLCYASLGFDAAAITGRYPSSADIGIYQYDSAPFQGVPSFTDGSLARNQLAQP
jgi:hypothetical protein